MFCVPPAWYHYFYRLLSTRAHPAGLVRVLTIVSVLGVLHIVLSAFVAVRAAETGEPDLGVWFAIGVPALWTVPIWFAYRTSSSVAVRLAPARVIE
jgi:hypothetical protein